MHGPRYCRSAQEAEAETVAAANLEERSVDFTMISR